MFDSLLRRILTAVATLRMQERNMLDYITEAGEARLRARAVLSLLPHPLPFEMGALAA